MTTVIEDVLYRTLLGRKHVRLEQKGWWIFRYFLVIVETEQPWAKRCDTTLRQRFYTYQSALSAFLSRMHMYEDLEQSFTQEQYDLWEKNKYETYQAE